MQGVYVCMCMCVRSCVCLRFKSPRTSFKPPPTVVEGLPREEKYARRIIRTNRTHDGDGVNECSDDHVGGCEIHHEDVTDHLILLLRRQIRPDHEDVSESSKEGEYSEKKDVRHCYERMSRQQGRHHLRLVDHKREVHGPSVGP